MMNTRKQAVRPGISERELKVARRIQADLPAVPRPFLEIGTAIGLDETEVIETVRAMMEKKYIRKVGAVLRHQKAGFAENAILIAAVDETVPGRAESVGRTLASFKEISHCYQREPKFLGKFGLFAMVHSRPGEIDGRIKAIVQKAGITDFLVLRSLQEFKKISMELF